MITANGNRLSWILPRLIGVTHANDLLLSSRVFQAEEALTMGFLNKVLSQDDLLDHVYNYAGDLARNISPGSLRESKRQLYADLHRSVAAAVADSERLLHEMAKHPDYKEGVKAWMDKRSPDWSN